MSNHHESRNYICNQCDKSFCMEWRLKKHIVSHGIKDRRKCHFFNNGKNCPYDEVGCMFAHKLASFCEDGLECVKKLCQFQHQPNNLNDNEINEEIIQSECFICDTEFGSGTSAKTIRCDQCDKYVCRVCALKMPISMEFFACKICLQIIKLQN